MPPEPTNPEVVVVSPPAAGAARLRSLLDLAQRLAPTTTLHGLAHTVGTFLQDTLSPDALYFAVKYTNKDLFRFLLFVDTDTNGAPATYSPDEEQRGNLGPIFQRVVATGQSHLEQRTIEDLTHPDSVSPVPNRFGRTDRVSFCMIFAPIVHDTIVIGIMSVQTYPPAAYSDDVRVFLDDCAKVIAPHTARLLASEAFIYGSDDEYFRDNRDAAFADLLYCNDQTRRSSDNKAKCRIILKLLYDHEHVSRDMIEEALRSQGYKLPPNLSELILNRLGPTAQECGFEVTARDRMYHLEYRPGAKAIMFFRTKPGERQVLVDLLRLIDRDERGKLEKKGIRIIEAGAVIGEHDVYCCVASDSLHTIVAEFLDIIVGSGRAVRSRSRGGGEVRVSDLIERTETFPVVPGMNWRVRRGMEEERKAEQ